MSDANSDNNKLFGTALQIKFSAGSETAGQFVAYASTFGGSPDGHGDIVAKGAFKQTLIDHQARATWPALLWAHDQTEPIGVFTGMQEDAKGLLVHGKLALDSQRGYDAYALMKIGALGLSIGYQSRGSTKLANGVRQLNEVRVYEISAVAMPSNTNAKIISVKVRPSVGELQDLRVAERILRDGGYSSRQATAIVSHGKTAFKQRDVAEADDRLAKKIMAAASHIRNVISPKDYK